MPDTPQHIQQAQQSLGKKIAAEKIPFWHDCPDIIYPVRLSLEQCSSQWTALYKTLLVHGETLMDLTGGMGVDCSFLAQSFKQTTYVEQDAELCRLATHNFACLGLPIRVINDTCEHIIDQLPAVDVIFIDPARRDQKGGKMVGLSDCTPDLTQIGSRILQKCRTLLIKLSPMIDIESVLKDFPQTTEIHIVSVKNECKEVLIKIDQEANAEEATIYCVDLHNEQETSHTFCFKRSQENQCIPEFDTPQHYLYEPNASILKAGAFKQVAERYGVNKLHPSSHLYTSQTFVPYFPGKVFAIEKVCKVQRKEIADIEKANLTIRNFPGTVAELRKKLKLKDGGDKHIFATTLRDNSKVLIVGNRVRS